MRQMGKPRRLAVVETGRCVACGCCVRVCPRQAIAVESGVWARVDGEKCVGCGRCVDQCPAGIIRMEVASK